MGDTDPQAAALVERFLDAVWMERGLSDLTLAAYRSDLTAYSRWLAPQAVSLLEVQSADLNRYLIGSAGASPRSQARRLSVLRRFYRYLVREGIVRSDPTAEVSAPRLGRMLPKSITEQDVERLLAAPDTEQDLGLRDRAMLELMYATGLRVSELR